jgi:hypothetical protein
LIKAPCRPGCNNEEIRSCAANTDKHRFFEQKATNEEEFLAAKRNEHKDPDSLRLMTLFENPVHPVHHV